MASAPHPPNYTIQAADRCDLDHSGDHATRIVFAVILSSQQVADVASHNAGAVVTASGTPPATGQWVAALEVLLFPEAA